MTRLLKILLLSAVFASSSLLPSHAALKAGAMCKKVGQVSIQGKNSFKCVKSGKKLIWSKVKQNSSPAPTPAPTPNPTLSPTATPAKEVSKFAQSTQEILEEVWKSSMKSESKYQVFIEPARSDSKWAKENLALMEATLELLTKMGYPATTEVKAYIGWDWKWIQQYVPQQTWCYNGQWAGGGNCGGGINFVNLKFLADWQRSGNVEIEWPSEEAKFQGTSTLSHEVAHQGQVDYLAKLNRGTYFYPAWIREGAPELIKTFVYGKVHNQSYLAVRENYFKMTERKCKYVKLDELLMSGNHPDNCQGVAGLLALEALLATTRDVNSLFNFGASKIAGNGPGFDNQKGISKETYQSVMKEMFGIDTATWHPIVEAEFVKWAPAP
jgi:hypothetical protein